MLGGDGEVGFELEGVIEKSLSGLRLVAVLGDDGLVVRDTGVGGREVGGAAEDKSGEFEVVVVESGKEDVGARDGLVVDGMVGVMRESGSGSGSGQLCKLSGGGGVGIGGIKRKVGGRFGKLEVDDGLGGVKIQGLGSGLVGGNEIGGV